MLGPKQLRLCWRFARSIYSSGTEQLMFTPQLTAGYYRYASAKTPNLRLPTSHRTRKAPLLKSVNNKMYPQWTVKKQHKLQSKFCPQIKQSGTLEQIRTAGPKFTGYKRVVNFDPRTMRPVCNIFALPIFCLHSCTGGDELRFAGAKNEINNQTRSKISCQRGTSGDRFQVRLPDGKELTSNLALKEKGRTGV